MKTKIGTRLTEQQQTLLKQSGFLPSAEAHGQIEDITDRKFDATETFTFRGSDRKYWVPNTRSEGARKRHKRDDSDVVCGSALFVDHDSASLEEQVRTIKDLPIPPSFVIFTGGKSLHYYFWLDGGQSDLELWKRHQKGLIRRCGGDKSCHNEARLMAHPYHPYSEGITPWIATTNIASGKTYKWDTLAEHFPPLSEEGENTPAPIVLADQWDAFSVIEKDMDPDSIRNIAKACRNQSTGRRLCVIAARLKDCPPYDAGHGDGDGRYSQTVWAGKLCNHLWFTDYECGAEYNGSDEGWSHCKEFVTNFLTRWLGDNDGNVHDVVSRGKKPPQSVGSALTQAGVKNYDKLMEEIYTHCKPAYNEATRCTMMNGKPASKVEHLAEWLFSEGVYWTDKSGNKCPFPKERTVSVFMTLAHRFSYHPVRDHLNSLAVEPTTDQQSRYERLASTYLGDGYDPSKPPTLADIQLRKWLASAVQRVMEPGSRSESILLLRGAQGARKSSFFATLGYSDKGRGWFSGNSRMSDVQDKDGVAKFHGNWINEVQEIHLERKYVDAVKAFITETHDTYRPPYGRVEETFPRSFVVCATTNNDGFFVDESGNRRFWVITTDKDEQNPIDTDQLKADRDWIWAMAVKDWSESFQTWLTKEEAKQNNENNQAHKQQDPNEDRILWALKGDGESGEGFCPVYRRNGKLYVNTTDIMDYANSYGDGAFRKPSAIPYSQRKQELPHITKALRGLGFTDRNTRFVVKGKGKRRFMEFPSDFDKTGLNIIQ